MNVSPGATYRFWGHRAPAPRASMSAVEADGAATLRLYDPIDSWGGEWGVSAKEFADALDGISSSTREIRLHINSPGGEVFEAFAILNLLRSHPARVVAVVDGLAASAASFIAAGADELVMAPNSELMIHDAWGVCIGNAADMRDLAGRLDHLSDNVASIYAAKAGGGVPQWRDAMLAETWYSAQEAVSAGLADRVGQGERVAEAAAARFDLSVFSYQGRREAPAPGQARPRAESDGVTFAVGDRVRVTIDPPHAPGQSAGTVAEIGGTAYGIVFDDMPDMGIHRWYTAAEVEPSDSQPEAAEPGEAAEPDMPGMSARQARRHRHNARRVAA